MQSDRLEAAYTIYTGDAERLDRARDLLTREDLPALVEAERERGAALTERFWDAKTQGLAQAQLQAALSEVVTDLEFRNPRVQSAAIIPVDYAPGLWRVQAQFNGIYEPGAELQVVHALATHPKKIVVERLDLRRRDRRMTVLVSAWFTGIEDAEPTTRS